VSRLFVHVHLLTRVTDRQGPSPEAGDLLGSRADADRLTDLSVVLCSLRTRGFE